MSIKPLLTMPQAGLLTGSEIFYAQQNGQDVQVLASQFITYTNYLNIPNARDGTPYAQLPDMVPAIQAAINATPTFGQLVIPPGTYKLIGSGSSCLTITKQISLIGVGNPLFIVDPTVPATRNIITIAPVGNTYGWEIAGFQISGSGGVPFGKHAIFIDLTSGTATLFGSFIHDLIINPTANGNSIFISNVNANGGFFNNVLERNFLDSLQMLNVGDNIHVANNTFNSTVNTCIVSYQVSGAGNLKIIGNALASVAGAIITQSGISNIIRDNEIETPPGSINTLGSLVVVNNAGGPQQDCQLLNNQIQVLAGTGNPIPITNGNGAVNTYVSGGRLSIQSGSHINVLAGSNSLKIDTNSIECDIAGVVKFGPTITDAGTFTNLFPVIIPPGTVASLPAASVALRGAKSSVTDANATFTAGIGAVVAGGGANVVPVFCDGTNWRIG